MRGSFLQQIIQTNEAYFEGYRALLVILIKLVYLSVTETSHLFFLLSKSKTDEKKDMALIFYSGSTG